MHRILVLVMFSVGLVGCGQTKQKDTLMATLTKRTEQDILNIYQTVTRYKEETHYGVRVKSNSINFQILINDRVVFATRRSKRGAVLNGAYSPINYGILKAGEQQITIKMFPAVVDKKTEVKHAKLYNNAYLEVEIVADDFIDGESTGEYPIYEWKCPTEEKEMKNFGVVPVFLHPELPYYEHKDVFEAEDVPYNITGWQSSVVIKPRNKEEIEKLTKQVVAAYEEMRELFQNKDLDDIANKLYNSEKIEAQQLYFNKEDSREKGEDYLFPYKFNNFKMMPLENYKLVIYGNGRLVGLELIGPKNETESALWSQFNESTATQKYTNTIQFYRFLLHRPTVFSKLEWI